MSFILLGSMQVCLVPSGNLICTYHIVYGSITEYLFKFPQHGTLFLLSETVLILFTTSKSKYFPARHYFAFHLISGEFLPMRSSRWKFNTWLSLILGPLPSNTHNFIDTEVKTNCLMDLRCLVHKWIHIKHFKR